MLRPSEADSGHGVLGEGAAGFFPRLKGFQGEAL